MWPDNETARDLIGFRVHADLIKEVISDPALLPVTVGVFGDWGNGKTSIMQMLEADLSQDGNVAVIYFDAWLFEGYDDAKSALLTAILAELSKRDLGPEFAAKVKDLLGRVSIMRLLRLGWKHVAVPTLLSSATGGATPPVTVPSADDVLGVIKEKAEEILPGIREFRDDFSDLLEESKFTAVVVLIDDLDRCSPDRIVENLEAI